MKTLKKNVSVFNSNVADNGGYLYTTNASLSSIFANKRITDAMLAMIDDTVHTVVNKCGFWECEAGRIISRLEKYLSEAVIEQENLFYSQYPL